MLLSKPLALIFVVLEAECCLISNGFLITFKVLYKNSIDTVDRPVLEPATKLSDGKNFNFATKLAATFSDNS